MTGGQLRQRSLRARISGAGESQPDLRAAIVEELNTTYARRAERLDLLDLLNSEGALRRAGLEPTWEAWTDDVTPASPQARLGMAQLHERTDALDDALDEAVQRLTAAVDAEAASPWSEEEIRVLAREVARETHTLVTGSLDDPVTIHERPLADDLLSGRDVTYYSWQDLPAHRELMARRDRMTNYLYVDWWRQQFVSGCMWMDLLTLSEPIAARALVRLAVYVRNGWELLAERYLGSVEHMPSRDALKEFHTRYRFSALSDETFVGTLYCEVPGSLGATHLLLRAYADAVVAEWEAQDGWPDIERDVPEYVAYFEDAYPDIMDLRNQKLTAVQTAVFERAVAAYKAGEGGVKQIASRFGLSRDPFMRELIRRGLLRQHGGRRSVA